MRKLLTLIVPILCTFALSARSPRTGYDLAVRYNFDNMEFDRGGNEFLHSMTLNAVNLFVTGGFDFQESNLPGRVSHSVRTGVSAMHDMGGRPLNAEWIAYYSFNYRFDRDKSLTGAFGVYPVDFLDTDEYSRAFVSDSVRFYDRAYEGMMFKLRTPRARAELWLDWMGRHGQTVRERFRVGGSGRYWITPYLQAGAAVTMYHFAGSVTTPGVVDNVLSSPYLRLDFSKQLGLRQLSLKVAFLAGYQRDRKFGTGTVMPMGGELTLRTQWRCLGVENVFYAGDDQMPFYDDVAYGKPYAASLYYGSPFYRASTYDRLELYFEPRISERLDFRISAVFHFATSDIPYQGTQQMLSLLYRL